MTPARRLAALVLAGVGLILIISLIANNLFRVGPSFEEMIDDFRPMLDEDAIATARADIAQLDAVGAEFEQGVVPAMADQLGMTPEEFTGFTAENYPAVATGMDELPAIATTFDGLITTLDSQRDLFESADAIPTESLPATTVPWGLAAVAFGAFVASYLLIRDGRAGVYTAGGLGAAVLVAVLVLSLVPKANDADELNDNLRPVYTPELVAQAEDALAVVGAMGAQMQTEMLPDLGTQLGMTEVELQGFFGQNFPATAGALADLPQSTLRFQSMVETFGTNLDNYDTIEPVTFGPIIWTLFSAGFVMLATAIALVVIERPKAHRRMIDVRDVEIKHELIEDRPLTPL